MKRRTRLFEIICLVSLGVVVGGAAIAGGSNGGDVRALSYENYQRIDFTFNPTIQMTLSSTDLTIDGLTLGHSGDSNVIDIGVGTNVMNGLQLTATVNGANNKLERVGDTSENKDNFAALESSTSSLSDFGANTWGYSYSADNGSSWANYNGLTVNPGAVLASTSGAAESTIKFKIGAKAGANQAAGTYTNSINFTAVTKMRTTHYNVTFHSGNGTTGMPANVSGGETDSTALVPLGSGAQSESAPVRDGYIFNGWCTVSTNDSSCSGNVYQADETYPISSVTSADDPVNIDLYAMWKSTKIYMQDLDSTSIAALLPTIGSTATVYDKRDEKPYIIGRLKMDAAGTTSAYWMLENLALDITAVDLATLKGNTNATDTTLEYLKGTHVRGDGNIAQDSNYPTTAVGYADSSNYYSVPKVAVSGTCYNAYCVDGGTAGSPWSYDDETSETINGVTSVVQGKIGVYYNYCAASAGSYCYGSGTSNTGSPSSDPNTSTIRDVTEDICPAGWRLPTSSSNGEFATLYSAYGSNYADFQTALSTPLSGSFSSGTARSQGSNGRFWSSTWYGTSNMYRLYVDSSYVNPSYYTSRDGGSSVRCLLGS